MTTITRNIVALGVLTILGEAASAVTFSNVIIQSSPLSTGSSYSTIGSSISFFTPNAIVGDVVDPLRSGTLNIQYDADAGSNIVTVGVGVNLATALSGSGTVVFTELVFEIDSAGNEVGGPIGSDTHLFNSSSSMFYSNNISLSKQVQRVRVKKGMTLAAPATSAVDLAAVAIVNQSINTGTPEPASMVAIGLGVAGLVASRRRNRK